MGIEPILKKLRDGRVNDIILNEREKVLIFDLEFDASELTPVEREKLENFLKGVPGIRETAPYTVQGDKVKFSVGCRFEF